MRCIGASWRWRSIRNWRCAHQVRAFSAWAWGESHLEQPDSWISGRLTTLCQTKMIFSGGRYARNITFGKLKRLQNTVIVPLAARELFRFKPANTSVSHCTVVVAAHGKWGITFWTISVNSVSRLIKKFTTCYTAHFTNRLTRSWNTLYRMSTKDFTLSKRDVEKMRHP